MMKVLLQNFAERERDREDTYNIILEGRSTQRTRLACAVLVDFFEATFAERVLAWSAHNVTLAAQADSTSVLGIVHFCGCLEFKFVSYFSS